MSEFLDPRVRPDFRNALQGKSNLYLPVDFGTSKSVVNWAILGKGINDPHKATPEFFHLNNFSKEDAGQISTLIHIAPDSENPSTANLLFGDAASEQLEDNPEADPDLFFNRIKLSRALVDPETVHDPKLRTNLKVLQHQHAITFGKLRKFDVLYYTFPKSGKKRLHLKDTRLGLLQSLQAKQLKLPQSQRLSLEEMEERVTVESARLDMAGLVTLYLKYLYERVQVDFEHSTGLRAGQVKKLLQEHTVFGVAVPDSWTPEIRSDLYSLMVGTGFAQTISMGHGGAGYPTSLLVLSEAKATGVCILKGHVQTVLDSHNINVDRVIEELESTTFVITDLGAGTADTSVLRVKIHRGTDRQICYEFASVVDSMSYYNGGSSINDAIFREISGPLARLHAEYERLRPSNMPPTNLKTFIRCFEQSIERIKIAYGKNGEKKEYFAKSDHTRQLPILGRAALGGDISSTLHGLRIDHKLLARCYKEQVAPLIGPNGCIAQKVNEAKQVHYAENPQNQRRYELLLAGGASLANVTVRMIENDKTCSRWLPRRNAGGKKAWVAEGSTYLLLNPSICDQKILNRSYGLDFEDKYDPDNSAHLGRDGEQKVEKDGDGILTLQNCINWLSPMGSDIRDKIFQKDYAYVFWHQGDLSQWHGDELDWRIWATSDPTCGLEDGWDVEADNSIEQTGSLKVRVSKALALDIGKPANKRHFGFERFGDWWRLEFPVRVIHKWSGMIHEWKLLIPYGNSFDSGLGGHEVVFVGRGDVKHACFSNDHNAD